jgi:hypothetical protein
MKIVSGTNWLMCLVLILVGAITSMNQYTTHKHCEMYLEGVDYNNEKTAQNIMFYNVLDMLDTCNFRLEQAVDIAQSESCRADRMEANFDDLTTRYVKSQRDLQEMGIELYHLNECLNEQRVAEDAIRRQLSNALEQLRVVLEERDALLEQQETTQDQTEEIQQNNE